MTGRRAGRTPPLEIIRRDWKPPLLAVVVPSVLYALLTVYLLAAAAHQPGEHWRLPMLQLATVFGRGVIEQIGWIFGILTAIQLGCLIALLGGQFITRNRRDEADLRIALSLFSALPVVALSPALTVASIAAFRVAELRGSIFVIVPAYVLIVALAIFIGTLEVADELTKLQMEEFDRGLAQERLDLLEGRPGRGFWPVIVIRSLISMAVACIPLVPLLLAGAMSDVWTMEFTVAFAFAIILIPLSTLVLATISASLKPSLTPSRVALSGMLFSMLIVLQITFSVTLLFLGYKVAIGPLVVDVVLAIDAVRVLSEARDARAGRVSTGFWRSGGMLAQAGTSAARKSAEKELRGAEVRVAECKAAAARRVQETPGGFGKRRKDDGDLGIGVMPEEATD